jgi:hypothetical protein
MTIAIDNWIKAHANDDNWLRDHGLTWDHPAAMAALLQRHPETIAHRKARRVKMDQLCAMPLSYELERALEDANEPIGKVLGLALAARKADAAKDQSASKVEADAATPEKPKAERQVPRKPTLADLAQAKDAADYVRARRRQEGTTA